MTEVLPNLVGLAGYACTTVPGLVRAIFDVYAAVATIEGTAAPTIQFGRRYIEAIAAPNRIVLAPRKGPIGGVREMGSGKIGSIGPVIEAHIWGGEPTQTGDELADELSRFDLADPLVARFLNVLSRVAPGKIELLDLDPDAGQSAPGSVNEYGESYVLTFRFLQDVARDGVVFSVLPTLDVHGLPTPQISPPPNYAATGAGLTSLAITTTPTG